ncbi:MAG: Rieske (2Fe-2S) protein [Actinobacteria bacterium]|nr:Rieske (2Fe-2S) protein [Actinomycetota bacterium]
MPSTTSTAHDVGAVADFEAGRPYRVQVNGRGVVLVRRGEAFYALRDACAHQGARLSGGRVLGLVVARRVGEVAYERAGEILACPWHGWEYDLTTGCSLVDPRGSRVRAYQARVAEGRVLVELA